MRFAQTVRAFKMPTGQIMEGVFGKSSMSNSVRRRTQD